MPQRERPLCEGCGVKTATFGTPTERERRWCGGCGKAHGAIMLAAKMCQGCGVKRAHFGTPTVTSGLHSLSGQATLPQARRVSLFPLQHECTLSYRTVCAQFPVWLRVVPEMSPVE